MMTAMEVKPVEGIPPSEKFRTVDREAGSDIVQADEEDDENRCDECDHKIARKSTIV